MSDYCKNCTLLRDGICPKETHTVSCDQYNPIVTGKHNSGISGVNSKYVKYNED